MKLGIVANEFPPDFGGMQQHALGLADTLSQHYDVTVYTNICHKHYPYNHIYPVKPILNGSQIDFDVLKSEPVDVFLILNAAYSILSTKTHKPIFSYCHGNDFLKPWIQILPSLMSNNIRRLDRVPYLRRYQERLCLALDRRQVSKGLEQAKAIFTNSTWTQHRLLQVYRNLKNPIHVSYPGVAGDFFTPVTRKNKGYTDAWRFLTVARLTAAARRKNVDNVLRALASIKDNIKFQYTIIGDGDLREDLQQLTKHLGLNKQTTFTGNLASEDLRRWLDNSDLFILPSKASDVDVESFGIVYAEAAARGVPSLASRAGGATEAISHGISGVLIEESSPEAIVTGIQEFLHKSGQFDPIKIQEFAKQFWWQNSVGIIWNAIEKHRVAS